MHGEHDMRPQFRGDAIAATFAREKSAQTLAGDIGFILETLGYEVDLEEAIAPRDW